jgi:hypothetical protein
MDQLQEIALKQHEPPSGWPQNNFGHARAARPWDTTHACAE